MKKFVLFLMVITASILMVTACAGTPEPALIEEPQPPAPPPPAPPSPPPAPEEAAVLMHAPLYTRHQSGVILDEASHYTVRYRDTLASIARRFYRDGSLYPLIYMVTDEVSDPDLILPGMILTLPVVDVNMEDQTARESINRSFIDSAVFEERRGRGRTAALIRSHVH